MWLRLGTRLSQCRIEELSSTYAQEVAQLLRVEHMQLATQEIQDTMLHRIAHGLDDLIIIDWHAALLYGQETHDVRAALEFANVELLETRYLDKQLDDALDQAYATLSRRRTGVWKPWNGLSSC